MGPLSNVYPNPNLLDIVVREGTAILKLLSSKDQTLLIWGNSLLVLDFGLDILNSIGSFDLESDGLARKGLHENLHFLVSITGLNEK